MPIIRTQQDLRLAQNLPFCYLCGKAFNSRDIVNRDHLPPSTLFDKEDRDPPLILPTHKSCNSHEHISDELLGQFFTYFRGKTQKPRSRRLDIVDDLKTNKTFSLSQSFDLHHFIVRCLRGFHAALYWEWLPEKMDNAIHPPIRGGKLDGATRRPTDKLQEMLVKDAGVSQHALLCGILKKNRVARNTDRVVTRNGKCTFECIWTHLDNGTPVSVFGIKIYEWQCFDQRFGYPSRGCVGIYSPPSGRPRNGTKSTALEFPFTNDNELDPFGS